MSELLVTTAVSLFFIVGSLLAYQGEKKSWNGGHCPECASLWESFDMDSSGARGYKCSGWGWSHPGVWISWGLDR